MTQTWEDLLFAHWPVPARELAPFVPAPLELDLCDGVAWVGVVPFRMSGVRPRGSIATPYLSAFPEINVRTYVKTPDRNGVWFFSLDATNRLAVRVARAWYGLPYFDARIDVEHDGENIRYHSTRVHRRAAAAAFDASYSPNGPAYQSARGTLDDWFTERYCLFASGRRGRIGYGDIHHAPWPLQPAEAEIRINTMTDWLGVTLPTTKPMIHFARRLDVVAWSVARLGSSVLPLG